MSNRTSLLFLAALTSLSVSAIAQQSAASSQAASPPPVRAPMSAIQAVVPGPLAAPVAQAAPSVANPASSEARAAPAPLIAPGAAGGSSPSTGTSAVPMARPAVPAAPQTTPAGIAAPNGTPAVSVPANPFNGAALTPEQLQRELDLSRAQTRALEDKLLQSLPPEQAKALQARREQEAARAAKPDAPAKAERTSAKPATAEGSAAKPRKAAVKPKRRAQPVKEVFENDLAETEDPGRPALVSIVAVGSRYSVIFEVDGRTFTALDGELTPFGRLTVWDESCIDLGDTRLRLMGGRSH